MAYHILRADNLLTARSPLRSPEKYRATLKISAFMIHEIFFNRARMVYTHHMTEYSPAKSRAANSKLFVNIYSSALQLFEG